MSESSAGGWTPKGEPHVLRVWVCEECGYSIPDDEARRNIAEWGHQCGSSWFAKKGQLCESHMTPFLPEEEK